MAKETRDIVFGVAIDADTSEADKVLAALAQMEDSLDDIAKETDKLTDETKEAERAQKKMADSIKGTSSSFRDMISLDVSGYFDAIVGAAGQAITASRNWALNVERTAKILSVSLEEAAAINVSFTQSGLDAAYAVDQLSSFQGRLIEFLERQKEVQKELAAIDRQRLKLIKEQGKAQAKHAETIQDLERQISAISNKEAQERIKARDKELGELNKDYNKFLEEQEDSEKQKTERLSKIWKDRVKRYNKDVLQATTSLDDELSRAQNVAEQRAIQERHNKSIAALESGLQEDNEKHQDSIQEQKQSREEAAADERELVQEQSAFIQQKANEDLEKIKANNAEQVASLQERIAEENEAWTEQQESFTEGLADIDRAQAEAIKSGGGLKFVLDELGVSIFTADGKMRDVTDIVWDMKAAFDTMPESARKSTLISDLNWEELAVWLERGAGATESLTKAQELGLVPSENQLDAIHKQNEALELLQLQLLGVTGKYFGATTVSEIFTTVLEAGNKVIAVTMDVWSQMIQILDLLIEKIHAGADASAEMMGISPGGGIGGLLGGIANTQVGGAGTVGSIIQTGADVLNTGIANTLPAPMASAFGLATETATRSLTVNINGTVNGVEDIDTAIRTAVQAEDNAFVPGGR
ncbi:MAG: hypothetical protein GY928_34020 [Colwellia sp.]|nr:hypothetical protein [Colwellia sp.]